MNLNQVTVPSQDVSASVAFYERLGLTLIVDALPHYARLLCPEGDATFSVHRVDASSASAGTYIYFECECLDQTVQKLMEQGINFDHGPQDQTWLWREARLKDPDGNQIVLYHAGTNRKNPPWRIN